MCIHSTADPVDHIRKQEIGLGQPNRVNSLTLSKNYNKTNNKTI